MIRALSLPWLIALGALPATVAAQQLSCPTPATLVQVAPCPTPEQLRTGYIGYCSDNARMYGADRDTCSSFENYLRLKNAARWESTDGAFQGYLSCELPAGAVASLTPGAMSIARQSNVTRVMCRYGDASTLTYRTKARCTLVDANACATDPAACRANCE
jgi:hypothetical protein